MHKPLQVAATLEGVSTLKDGGVTVRFHTQELTADEKTIAFNYQGQFGWLLFKETQHREEDLKELEAIRKDTQGKSPSQRQRNVIYLLYKQSGTTQSFEQYYARYMDQIIEQLKDKLE